MMPKMRFGNKCGTVDGEEVHVQRTYIVITHTQINIHTHKAQDRDC